MSRPVRQTLETGGLVLVPGLLAWLTGFPLTFPSLGPSADGPTTDLRHAPACATTLIVSLGLLSTPVHAAGIVVAVVVLVAVHHSGRATGLLTPLFPEDS